VSSRLALDGKGRRIVVITTPSAAQTIGMRFVVLGDALPCAEPGFIFTGTKTGRPNTVTAPRRNGRDWVPVDAAAR
jgi:hypothetical protein